MGTEESRLGFRLITFDRPHKLQGTKEQIRRFEARLLEILRVPLCIQFGSQSDEILEGRAVRTAIPGQPWKEPGTPFPPDNSADTLCNALDVHMRKYHDMEWNEITESYVASFHRSPL